MNKYFSLRLFAVLAVALMSIGYAVGQSSVTGAITGRVTDPRDAVIANATVKVTNIETGASSTATTSSEGTYRVANLQPGNYKIEVSAGGFAPGTASDLVVEVSKATSVDVKLGLVGQTAQVEVTGETPIINTVDPTNSTNVNQVSINNLPINGRRAASFALLTPGVNPDGGFGLLSFRGISGLMNNSTVDGGDDNQAFFAEQRGRTRINYAISADAVREFSVNTSNYSAEFGRSAGGVVNTVTKSGTNEFHGDGFFYARSEKWAARNADAFAKLPNGTIVGLKPRDRRYQFGGSLGGPIIHDRAFFFFSYDQQKRDFPAVSQPSSGETFFTSVSPGTVNDPRGTPAQGFTPATLTQAQINSGVTYIRNITGVAPRRGDQRLILPKLDWKLNDKNTLTAVWNHMRWNSPRGVQTGNIIFRSLTSFGTDLVDIDTVNLRLNSTLSSNMLNEGRFQWSRDFERQIAETPAPGEPTTGPGGFSPGVSIGGNNAITFGKPNFLNRSAFPDERRNQIADTLTWINGKQTYKFGGDFNHVSDVMGNLFQEGGIFNYADFAHWLVDFNSGGTTKFYNSFAQGFGPTTFKFRTNDYAFFGQLDYQVDQNLTLNFGMRWEYEQMPKPQIPNPALPLTNQFPSDKNNFGPRVGFAYSFGKDFENVIRAGYGMFYGRITNSAISNAITNTGLPTGQISVSLSATNAAQYAIAPFYPNVLASASSAGGGNVIEFANGFQNPLVHQMDVVYERRIGRNTVVSATGMISVGRFLPYFVDTNLRPPTATSTLTFLNGPFNGQTITVPKYTGTRPNTAFNQITEIRSSVSSEYYGFTLAASRRLTNGIQFQSSYTYSRATDNGQNSQTFTTGNSPLDPFNLDDERARSSFDVPNHFVASVVYSPNMLFGVGHDSAVGRAIFGGWTIAPIVTGSSGFAYTAAVGGFSIGGGTAGGPLGAGGSSRLPNTKPNSFRSPHFWDVDLRISRRFNLGEKRSLELLAEGFNIFNKQIVTGVSTTMYSLSGTTLTFQPAFGTTTSTNNFFYKERQIQLAARFSF